MYTLDIHVRPLRMDRRGHDVRPVLLQRLNITEHITILFFSSVYVYVTCPKVREAAMEKRRRSYACLSLREILDHPSRRNIILLSRRIHHLRRYPVSDNKPIFNKNSSNISSRNPKIYRFYYFKVG